MIAWKVSKDGNECLFESFREAREVYEAESKGEFHSIVMYPIFISREKFEYLTEFQGW